MKKGNSKRKIRDQQGMSLMEVVLVLVILAITIVPLTRLAVSNLKSAGRYALMNKAMFDVQALMEQILADYQGRGYTYTTSYWASSSGTTASGFGYSVSVSGVSTVNSVNFVTVTVTVSGSSIPNTVLSTRISN